MHRWLTDKFLPKTSLDAAVRTSVSTTFRYIGLIVSTAAALSYAGLNLGNVALIASALSVGIGFGLQAIVQNFISGLILLAERPIKIGDWVTVGDAEGDVRHINVRATQIELMARLWAGTPTRSASRILEALSVVPFILNSVRASGYPSRARASRGAAGIVDRLDRGARSL